MDFCSIWIYSLSEKDVEQQDILDCFVIKVSIDPEIPVNIYAIIVLNCVFEHFFDHIKAIMSWKTSLTNTSVFFVLVLNSLEGSHVWHHVPLFFSYPSEMTGCWWDSVTQQTPHFRSWLTSTIGKTTPLTTSQTTAPFHPWQSCRRGRWRGNTTLTKLLGERTIPILLNFIISFWKCIKPRVLLLLSSQNTQLVVALPSSSARSWRSQLLFSKRLWKSESHGHHILQTDL